MPTGFAHVWTEAQDAQLRRLRAEGVGWDEIAVALGHPVSTCMDRARAIGARRPAVAVPPAPWVDDTRGTLPAGHPTTWGLLVAGTVLEGARYG